MGSRNKAQGAPGLGSALMPVLVTGIQRADALWLDLCDKHRDEGGEEVPRREVRRNYFPNS